MNLALYKQTLKLSYRIGRPVCALSSPGLGKSSAVYQVSEELSLEYGSTFGGIEIRGASSNPAEMTTIKYVHGGVVKDAEQDWIPTNEKVAAGLCPERGIIFVDEVTASMNVVQSTLQRLFLDRILGNRKVADGWMVTAAGNRAKDKSAAGALSRAFQNRCMMVTIDPDPDLLHEYGKKKGFDYRTLAYLRFAPDCLQDGATPKKGENQAFCSPRSLHIVSDILQSDIQLSEHLQNELVCGTLGDGEGTRFNGFIRIMDSLPDLDKIIQEPDEYPVPEKLDVAWATVGALLHRATDKNAENILRFFVRLRTEVSIVAVKDLRNSAVWKTLVTSKVYAKWASSNIKFVQ